MVKYALALGGGGARGAFEAGVWQALMEMNKEISAVAGTSVGAINGAAFVCGADAGALWEQITAKSIIEGAKEDDLLSPAVLMASLRELVRGGLDTKPLKRLLETYISEDKLRRSGIEFGLCTYSADKMTSLNLFADEIDNGKLIDYIIASACFPLFKAVKINGETFSDGGIRNNLPVDMLISRGCDTIIAVPVHGVGLVRDADICGVNIIEIKSKAPEGGLMDFSRDAIRRSIKSGYFECKRTFGMLSGTDFYINNESYHMAAEVYGRRLVEGIERAAGMLGFDRYCEYDFSSLANAVVSSYKKNKSLAEVTGLIEKEGSFHNKLDMLGNIFHAANAIAYLKKK